jgi:hypothetical protein
MNCDVIAYRRLWSIRVIEAESQRAIVILAELCRMTVTVGFLRVHRAIDGEEALFDDKKDGDGRKCLTGFLVPPCAPDLTLPCAM